jgi:serine/threonine protein kinase
MISRLEHLQVQIADFGLSKAVDADARAIAIAKSLERRQRSSANGSESSSNSDDVVDPRFAMSQAGTKEYMAPEMKKSETPWCNKKCDIWSLGCVVLELASCHMIRPKHKSHKIWLDRHLALIPEHYSCRASLVSLIRGMLQEKPGRRLSTEELCLTPLVAVHLPARATGMTLQRSTLRVPQSVPVRSKSSARIAPTPQLQRQRLLQTLTNYPRTLSGPKGKKKRRRLR